MTDPRDLLGARHIEEFERAALTLADEARASVERAWRDGFTVERKADGSYVTSTDLEVEDRLRASIARRHPEHGVLGEEFPPARPGAEFQWILDPIDGTEDFVHRVPLFGSILALYFRGQPIVGVLDHPALGLRCHAAWRRGTWRDGARVRLADLAPDADLAHLRLVLSARANFVRYRDEGATFDALARACPNHRVYRSCFGHTLSAIGAVDAMVDFHDTPWDLAACQITLEEAGGAYRIVRRFAVDGVPICSAVLGRPRAVERLCALIDAPAAG